MKYTYSLIGIFLAMLVVTGVCQAGSLSMNLPGVFKESIPGENETLFNMLTINSGDTVVFDFSQATCTPAYVQVPVFFISDDDIYALDFAIKFDPSSFTYGTLVNHMPNLNNSISYNVSDSTLRYSTFSMTPIQGNTPMVSVRFNVSASMIGLSSFDSVRTWLNGDDCSFKSINLPASPPIFSGGITSIIEGDSVQLSVSIPSNFSSLWSTGSTSGSIWVFNAGVYTVGVTNPAGCTSTSSIAISVLSPLPVELVNFDGTVSNGTVSLNWSTASEVNNDYFIVEHADDGVVWRSLDVIDGSGTTSVWTEYSYRHEHPAKDINYYRLKQVDYDGSIHESEMIGVKYHSKKSNDNIEIFPNPMLAGSSGLVVSILSTAATGELELVDNTGRVIHSSVLSCNSGSDTNQFMIEPVVSLLPGCYFIRWTEDSIVLVEKLVIY